MRLAAATWTAAWLATLWGPPEPEAEQDGINWLLDAPWAKVALLVTLAVGVMVLANARMKARKGGGGRRKPDFDLHVAKLEQLPVSTIAAAKAGSIHVVGRLAKGEGALGTGPRACVYQNRAKSSRATAIAAELILLDDDTALVGLEQLEDARVIAPKEDRGAHDTIALYLGDRVEVVGELMLFPEPHDLGGRSMRGMLGSLGQIQVRVIERPEPDDAPDSTPDTPETEAPTP